MPVFGGCTNNSTHEAVEKAKKLARVKGLTGILTANPYYNKPGQEGQYQHFRAIAEAVDMPVLLYNIPGRTGVNLEPATVLAAGRDPEHYRREGVERKHRADYRADDNRSARLQGLCRRRFDGACRC